MSATVHSDDPKHLNESGNRAAVIIRQVIRWEGEDVSVTRTVATLSSVWLERELFRATPNCLVIRCWMRGVWPASRSLKAALLFDVGTSCYRLLPSFNYATSALIT
jgi:hypothetical protein